MIWKLSDWHKFGSGEVIFWSGLDTFRSGQVVIRFVLNKGGTQSLFRDFVKKFWKFRTFTKSRNNVWVPPKSTRPQRLTWKTLDSKKSKCNFYIWSYLCDISDRFDDKSTFIFVTVCLVVTLSATVTKILLAFILNYALSIECSVG